MRCSWSWRPQVSRNGCTDSAVFGTVPHGKSGRFPINFRVLRHHGVVIPYVHGLGFAIPHLVPIHTCTFSPRIASSLQEIRRCCVRRGMEKPNCSHLCPALDAASCVVSPNVATLWIVPRVSPLVHNTHIWSVRTRRRGVTRSHPLELAPSSTALSSHR